MANRNGRIILLCRMGIWLLVLGSAAVGYSQDAPHRADGAHAEESADSAHAEFEPAFETRPQESRVIWMARSLGAFGPLLLLAGGFCFVFTLAIIFRGNGPFAVAALALIVPIPLLLGLFGFFQGAIMSFQVIASSSVAPKPSELAAGISTALFSPLFGLMMTAPSLTVAVLGSLVRSLSKQPTDIRHRPVDHI